jgi:replicative DNA helicase
MEANVSGECKDANELLQADAEGLRRAVEDSEEAATVFCAAERESEAEAYRKNSAGNYIDGFLTGIAESADTPCLPTGFDELDRALDGGLYEGLYVIGAVSSLGKTTFALQVCDQIAAKGHDALIFSLEMARYELMSKSISRLTLFLTTKTTKDTKNAKTARGITDGKRYARYSPGELELIDSAVKAYSKYAGNIFIHEGMGNIGTPEVRETVRQHIEVTSKKPVIVVDYLQLLAPYDPRYSDKQNTDKAILELKRISRDYKIPVIAISSFNRQNYNLPVTMEAFKESGAIEYSSDVLIGLQARGAGSSGFDISHEKKKDPREVELKILKNRNGPTGAVVEFSYYALFNMFVEE